MKTLQKIDVLLVGPVPPAQSYVGGIAVLLMQQLAGWELPMSVAHFNTELWAREFGTTGRFNLKHILSFVINAVRLTGVIARRRPRLVHFHSSVRLALLKDVLLACWVRWIGGCKLVMHVHFAVADSILLGRSLWLRRLQLRLLLFASDRIVFLSQRVREELAGWLPRLTAARLLSKSSVLPNFTEIPDDATPGGTRGSPVKVFFIGNIGKRKGVYDLIHALPLVAACSSRPFQLILAGPFDSPEDERAILRLVAELRLSELVIFLGPVSGAAKSEAFRCADVFVLPSYGEGVPVSLIESMAHGIPVVVTDVGGIPETVTDGLEGFIIRPGNVTSLASSLARLIEAPDLRRQMGRAARARASKHHSVGAYFAALRPLYSSLQPTAPAS
jgi:glycosyltransferase involved in cell wall biosynthesis